MTQGHGVERIFPIHFQELRVSKFSNTGMSGEQNFTTSESVEARQHESAKRSVPAAGLDIERALWSQGYHRIVGVDEAGGTPGGTSGRGWCDSEP